MFKKNLWIVALIAALAMIFAGCDNGGKENKIEYDPNKPDHVIEGADITVISIGSTPGGSAAGNVYTLASTSIADGANLGSAGFGFVFPKEGFEYKYVRLEVEITEIDNNSAVAFTVKKSTSMDDLAGFGANSKPAYSRNSEINVGDKVGDTGITMEMEGDTPVTDKFLVSLFGDGIYAQFNPYSEYWHTGKTPPTTWEDATIVPKLKGNQNFKLKITKVTFTNGGAVDPNAYVPVTGINEVPEKSVPGLIITLPERAAPATATSRDVTWSLTDKGATNAALTGNVLKGITAKGTIKVKATVAKGLSATQDFTKDFDIVVGDPNGVFLTDFSELAAANTNAAYDAGTWTLSASWNGIRFDIGQTLSSTDFIYDAVTIAYTVTARDDTPANNDGMRFSFGKDGSALLRTLAGDFHGGYEGTTDLNPVKVDDKNVADVNQVRIPIADIGEFNRFIIESKGVVPVKIQIHAVYIEKKVTCEFCDGTMPTHAGSCFIPVTSITRAPASNYVNLELELPAKAWPSYATNRDITWTGTGVTSGKFKPTAAGKVTLTGTVTNGLTASTNFVKTFEVDVTAAQEVKILGSAITSVAFGYGNTYVSPGVITINPSYQRAGINIGTSIYNALYSEAELVIVPPQNGRFGLFISGSQVGDWVSITGGAETTVSIDLSAAAFDDKAITQFAIENTGAVAGDFEIKSVTFKLK